MDRTLHSTSRVRGRLGLAALAACMLVSGQLLAMFGGPPRLPGRLPALNQLTAVLTGVAPPVDGIASVLVTCAWLLWFWIVGSLGLELLVLGAEAAARGTSLARNLRRLANRVTLPMCRRAVAAAFAVQILTRGVPVAAAEPLPATEISRPLVSTPAHERHVALDTHPTYRVVQGDTLWTISEKTYGNGHAYRQLVEANIGRRMPDGELFTAQGVIRPGWELVLPPVETLEGDLVYTVRPGDTLTSLARRLLDDENRWREIFDLNRDIAAPDGGRALTNPDLIWPGMRLRIPPAQPPAMTDARGQTDEDPATQAIPTVTAPVPPAPAPPEPQVWHTPADADHRERDRASEPRSMVTASIRPTEASRAAPEPQLQAAPEATPEPVVLMLADADSSLLVDAQATATAIPEPSDSQPRESETGTPSMPLVIGGAAAAVAVGAAALGVGRVRRWRPLPAEPESDVVVSGGYAEAKLADAFTHRLQGGTADPAAALASQYRAFLDEYNLGHVAVVSVAYGRSTSSLTVATPLGEQDLLLDLAPVFGTRLESDVQASISVDQDVVLRVIRRRKTRLLVPAGQGGSTDSLLVPLGVLYNRQVLSAAWSSIGHILVASRPGHGADTILTSLVATLAARCSPETLKLWRVGKPRSLPAPIEDLPHLERDVDPSDAGQLHRLVDDLQAELEYRVSASADSDLVVVLPELRDVMDAWSSLALLAGRALNGRVHLLAATTAPELPIEGGLLAQFSTRMVLHLDEEEHSMALLGNIDAAFLGGGGRLLLRLEDREPVEMYGYQVSDEHLEHLVRVMRTAYAPPRADPGLTGTPAEPDREPAIEQPAASRIDPDSVAPLEPEPDTTAQTIDQSPAQVVDAPTVTVAPAPLAPAAPIRVWCFGSPRVECHDTQLWPRRRAANTRSWELILFLACHRAEGVSRQDVVAALWPDDVEGEEAVAHRIRQIRQRLRGVLADVPGAPAIDGIIYNRTDGLLLLDPAVVYSDAREFLDALHTARSRVGFDTIPLLERARALYTGDLLDGPEVRKYTWLDERGNSGVTMREHFRRQFQQATGSLAELYAAQGRCEEAITVYRDLTDLDPGEDRAWQQLFRLHAIRKDRPALLREERRMRQVLRELAADEDGPTSPAMLEPARETVREFNRVLAQLDGYEREQTVIAS